MGERKKILYCFLLLMFKTNKIRERGLFWKREKRENVLGTNGFFLLKLIIYGDLLYFFNTMQQVIIGLDTAEIISEMEALGHAETHFGIDELDDDDSDFDDEDNDEDSDGGEEDDNHEKVQSLCSIFLMPDL